MIYPTTYSTDYTNAYKPPMRLFAGGNVLPSRRQKDDQRPLLGFYSYNTDRGSITRILSGLPRNSELIDNLRRLDDIRELKDDWNGNGARAFSPEHVECMRRIISRLHKQPFISPTANGSIQFEYEDKDGNYLEFELFPNKMIKEFKYSSEGEASTEYISIDEVKKAVEDFYRAAAGK